MILNFDACGGDGTDLWRTEASPYLLVFTHECHVNLIKLVRPREKSMRHSDNSGLQPEDSLHQSEIYILLNKSYTVL